MSAIFANLAAVAAIAALLIVFLVQRRALRELRCSFASATTSSRMRRAWPPRAS